MFAELPVSSDMEGGGMYSMPAPWPNAGYGYGGFSSRPGPDVQTDHCLGKKALHYNLADHRMERETDEGARLEMTTSNCEVIMSTQDSDRVGLQKLFKKDKAVMIPVKIGDDIDVGLARSDELASRLDFSMPESKFKKLCKLLDDFNVKEKIDPESVDDVIVRMKNDRSKRTKAKLQSKLARLEGKGTNIDRVDEEDPAVAGRRERQREDPFASIAGMKVQKVEGDTRTNGTIIGGRSDDQIASFTVVWDTPDRAQTQHNLDEITALMTPVNDQGIVHQKIEAFCAVSIATPQQQRRRRLVVRRRPEDMAVDDDAGEDL